MGLRWTAGVGMFYRWSVLPKGSFLCLLSMFWFGIKLYYPKRPKQEVLGKYGLYFGIRQHSRTLLPLTNPSCPTWTFVNVPPCSPPSQALRVQHPPPMAVYFSMTTTGQNEATSMVMTSGYLRFPRTIHESPFPLHHLVVTRPPSWTPRVVNELAIQTAGPLYFALIDRFLWGGHK